MDEPKKVLCGTAEQRALKLEQLALESVNSERFAVIHGHYLNPAKSYVRVFDFDVAEACGCAIACAAFATGLETGVGKASWEVREHLMSLGLSSTDVAQLECGFEAFTHACGISSEPSDPFYQVGERLRRAAKRPR